MLADVLPRAFAIVLFLSISTVAIRQQLALATARAQQHTFGSGATAIVIDVVVRDEKGRPVTGLREEDFVLFEDDVRQRIGAFVEVFRPNPNAVRRASGSVAAGERLIAAAQNPGVTGPQFLAIVFDRLSNEARGIASKGALASLDTLRDGDYVGVFLADSSLVTVQPYTNDRARIRAAIRDLATRATTRFDGPGAAENLRNRDERGNRQPGDASPSVPVVAGAEFEGRPVDGRSITAREIQAVIETTNNSWELIQRDQAGYATTNALLAVVNGLGVLPGRKSLVFFAEGLAIPDAVLPHFRNVVASANRANVSAYTIDSAGLRAHSSEAVTGREVRAMGAAGLAGRGSAAMLERNEDVLRKDPRTSLSLLAEGTGGFLVENSNDLANAFRRVDADRRFYYLLTYSPSNTALDNTWRHVTVTVPNRNVTVRARTGYVANAGLGTTALLASENAAVAALSRTPSPSEIPVRSAALVFPGGSETRVAILAATDGTGLQFHRYGERFRADFTIVARILDGNGAVVRTASQPYQLTGPIAEAERTRSGDILFFRQPTLEPGDYTLEVAVHDALASKAGVQRTTFTVPARSAEGFHVSSLVLVRRAERAGPQERQIDNPLFLDDVVLYPSLGEPLPASSNLTLTCFLSLSELAGASPEVAMELLLRGARVAQGSLPLPAPDALGRVRYLGQISVGAVKEPGTYTLRLTVTKHGRSVVREAVFTIAG
jgi:VWFA-related protein